MPACGSSGQSISRAVGDMEGKYFAGILLFGWFCASYADTIIQSATMQRLYPASRSSSSGWKGKAPILMETENYASGTGSYVAMSKQQNELPAVVSTEIKNKKRECKESLDSPVDLDPLTAASKVQTLLNLSEAEKEKLVSELLQTSKDHILALKINPAWVAHYGAGAVTAVLDEIAEFDVPNGGRRDE